MCSNDSPSLREAEAGTQVETGTTEECCLLHCFPQLAQLAFLYNQGTTCPGMDPPTSTINQRMPPDQSDGGIFWIEDPSSQMTPAVSTPAQQPLTWIFSCLGSSLATSSNYSLQLTLAHWSSSCFQPLEICGLALPRV